MRIIKLASIIFLFICISFGTIGGCGDSEINIDGDGNGGIFDGDDNGLSQLCEDFINALCERGGECNAAPNFDNCVDFFELFTGCDLIENLPNPNQCIADLDNFDCVAFTEDTLLPDTCTPVGACDICETDADCPEELFCSSCFDGFDDLDGFPGLDDLDGLDGPPECTGVVDRCAPFSFFFVDCGDGFF